jgi:hypothetical protein
MLISFVFIVSLVSYLSHLVKEQEAPKLRKKGKVPDPAAISAASVIGALAGNTVQSISYAKSKDDVFGSSEANVTSDPSISLPPNVIL